MTRFSAPLCRRVFAAALLATAGLANAAPDIDAREAATAVAAGKITLIDIRTPPEWKETGVARGAKLINMLHPQGAAGFADRVTVRCDELHQCPKCQGRHGRQRRRPRLVEARPAGGHLHDPVLSLAWPAAATPRRKFPWATRRRD